MPKAKTISAKNARAWVSMISLKKINSKKILKRKKGSNIKTKLEYKAFLQVYFNFMFIQFNIPFLSLFPFPFLFLLLRLKRSILPSFIRAAFFANKPPGSAHNIFLIFNSCFIQKLPIFSALLPISCN